MQSRAGFDIGRIAGIVYLVVVVTGTVSIAYVPSQVIVRGDGTATVQRIVASEQLFRIGIAAGFVCYLAFLFLPLALYRMLKDTDRSAALAMVVLAVVSVPISLFNLTHKLEVLSLVEGAVAGGNLASAELAAAVLRSLARYGDGMIVAKLFWGLWLAPLGYLFWRSRRIPRMLGGLLILGCAGYLIDVFATVLAPGYPSTSLAGWVTRPAGLGEIGTCLWLLVFGGKGGVPKPDRAEIAVPPGAGRSDPADMRSPGTGESLPHCQTPL